MFLAVLIINLSKKILLVKTHMENFIKIKLGNLGIRGCYWIHIAHLYNRSVLGSSKVILLDMKVHEHQISYFWKVCSHFMPELHYIQFLEYFSEGYFFKNALEAHTESLILIAYLIWDRISNESSIHMGDFPF